jgi:hypothetical protein
MPVSRAINRLLSEYILSPFQYLRDSSAQARMAELINGELKAANSPLDVPAKVELEGPHNDFTHAENLRTNRTQLEMKIAGCTCDKHGITDVLILKSGGPVRLTCHHHGPADVIADINVDDVSVAIEMKACPSSMREQRAKCRKDVEKLYGLVRTHQEISAHFVFLDKSVSIGELANVAVPVHQEWISELEHTVGELAPEGRPTVAIWDIDPNSL